MKKQTIMKWMLVVAIFIILLTNATSIFASNEGMQIVQKNEKEYMIYIQNNTSNAFEFAFSNDKNANKDDLAYRNAATDTTESNANYIAYVDEDLYNTYFSKNTYIWARDEEGKYFVEASLVNLGNSIKDNEIETTNTMTKRISVDMTQTYEKPAEIKNDVKITKTVGKVVIKEDGTTKYQLVKVTDTGDYANFVKEIERIASGKVVNDYYAKLETSKEVADLYNKLIPKANDKNWETVKNNEILQPEEAKKDEQYVLWLKNENNGETKLDVQVLTCFEDYKPEVISEKIATKLPKTSDDPTLFIILAILLVATICVATIRLWSSKKEKIAKN